VLIPALCWALLTTREGPDSEAHAPDGLRSVTPTRGHLRRFVGEWAIPIVGAAAALLVVNIVAPASIGEGVRIASFALYWLPLALMWIASGRNLISTALWLAPAVSLSVAWLLGTTGIGWWIAAFAIGILCISFLPPAIALWAVVVSWLLNLVLRLSQSSIDRHIDAAAEHVRRRVWLAANAAATNGPAHYLSDLLAIRSAAKDLPTEDVLVAQLRRALLRFIDVLYDDASGIGDPPAGPAEALNAYWQALHQYRSRSLLYRILTLRRLSGA
jgi:hypothetical protein